MATSITGYPQSPVEVPINDDTLLEEKPIETLQFDCQNGQRLDELEILAQANKMIKIYHLTHCKYCCSQNEEKARIGGYLHRGR